jgi:hypothetical protein
MQNFVVQRIVNVQKQNKKMLFGVKWSSPEIRYWIPAKNTIHLLTDTHWIIHIQEKVLTDIHRSIDLLRYLSTLCSSRKSHTKCHRTTQRVTKSTACATTTSQISHHASSSPFASTVKIRKFATLICYTVTTSHSDNSGEWWNVWQFSDHILSCIVQDAATWVRY